MATVQQVANAALKRIIVQGASSTLEPDEYQDFIFAMNNFMSALAADGVALGYTVVSNIADQVTIPTGALRGLIANMAIEVAPDYGGVVSPALVEQARTGLDTMRQIGQSIPETAYPCTLPYGAGNYWNSLGLTQFFYPDLEAEILGESTGSIGLESQTDA